MADRKNRFCLSFLLLLLTFFSLFTDPLNSQVINSNWQWLHPKPQGNDLLWCKMWDANTWYMAGSLGTFVKTTNRGVNWIINHNAGRLINTMGEKGNIWNAHFFNQNSGILIGSSGVTKTTDGGNTFDSIPELYLNNDSWRGIYFLNNSTGYISSTNLTGTNGKLAKTTDGGNSWTFIQSVTPLHLYDIYTANDTLLLISCNSGNVQRSTDGGISWTLINIGNTSTLYKLCFINRDTGFVCGGTGTVRLTTDGGLNWVMQTTDYHHFIILILI